jgi:hypothetical protein
MLLCDGISMTFDFMTKGSSTIEVLDAPLLRSSLKNGLLKTALEGLEMETSHADSGA